MSTPQTLTITDVARDYLRCSRKAAHEREQRGTLPVAPIQRKPKLLYAREPWDCWLRGESIPTRHARRR